jgi:hypothetical protein
MVWADGIVLEAGLWVLKIWFRLDVLRISLVGSERGAGGFVFLSPF